MAKYFKAVYKDGNIDKSYLFEASRYNKDTATQWLNSHDIKNFLFYFEPVEPTPFGENGLIFSGEIGFDIHIGNLIPALEAGKIAILNTVGGSLLEGLLLHDAIKLMGTNPEIGVMGICASAATLPLIATKNRWGTPNSQIVIHNPSICCVAGDDDEMYRVGGMLEKQKLNLANLYAGVSGKSQDEILAIMKKDELLNAEEALALNLITNIKTNVEQKKEEEMSKETEEKVSLLERTIDNVEKRMKNWIKTIKNLTKTDVNGETLTIEREEGEPQVGDVATPDGTFTFEDGMVIVVADGMITEITPAAEQLPDETEALKTRIQELEAELDGLKNAKAEAETLKAQYNAGIATVNAEIAALREIKSKVTIEDKKNAFKTPQVKNDFDMERYKQNQNKVKEGK